ncbi:hypothetical protein AYL99_06704 [Fonsecaea erecta]|uniref:Uncharacterized protein n=1 Tax=Fonsecaea erecta TaxID=1367422 RepID=A0A178ZJ20_9EURO|nr:hypothetical protein AYL99_06704 [Fonsecaea erecta]OAP59406.1 hypothetical protein AYL99_06704 [Fonsecaea erecta]
MIRLPPSSLSLSERDIEFHLRQTQIYQGLLRQGFKKDDIIRYLNDYRNAAADAVYPGLQGFGLSTSSTVELSYRRPQPSPGESDRDQGKEKSPVCHGSSESIDGLITCFPDLSPDIEEFQDEPPDHLSDILGQGSENSPNGSPKSPRSLGPTLHLNQHAPRKSSLLRFAEVVSPERPSPDAEEGRPVPVPTATPMRKKYKRRSHTYPYQSSEQDSVAETLTQDQILDSLNQISLDDSLEDAPLELPPAIHTTAPIYPAQDVMFASPATESAPGDGSVHRSSTDIAQPTLGRRRSSSDVLGQMYFITDMPSSPPLPRTPANDYFGQEPASPGSPRLPSTPTPIRNAATLPRTEPRPHRPRYLDGSSYAVYNDSLPADSQPQTPADVARHPLITEQDAVYTAPPGMLRIRSVSVAHRDRPGWDRETAQQSPTARAINMRERRNRELTRSVQAEGVRLQRLRIRDESRFMQRALEADAAATGGNRAEMLSPATDDIWRDELEADRVGDENFETGNNGGDRGVMRAVSGNARLDLGGWNG